MAEGMVNHYLVDDWQAYSAGTKPAGYVHELAIVAMAEIGIDISRQRSKPVEEIRDIEFDLVVTVCDDAAENCPVWLGHGRRLHVGFVDPAKAVGSRSQRLDAFRQVRDEMRERLFDVLVNGTGSSSLLITGGLFPSTAAKGEGDGDRSRWAGETLQGQRNERNMVVSRGEV
jgi:arsenate reductase